MNGLGADNLREADPFATLRDDNGEADPFTTLRDDKLKALQEDNPAALDDQPEGAVAGQPEGAGEVFTLEEVRALSRFCEQRPQAHL